MNANLDKIALELYGKIQTRFSDINIGDENATVLSRKQDIPKARFFEFEYEENGEPLGTITITLDADDGIIVQVSGDLVDDQDSTTRHSAYKFIRSFRQFAKDRLLNFDIQNIGKSNLDKRDYTFQAKRKEEPVMAQQPVMENKLYGSIKLSYQDLGEARLIIKHSQPVDVNNPAGRTMHIEGIYIENIQGERFKYPYKHLNGARALAEHIKHGGNPYDAIGQHICNLSEELAGLRKFKGYVSRQSQLSEAMSNVTSRVMERIEEIKKTIQQLQRPAYYEQFAESFEAREEVVIPEEVANDLIDRLTIRTFNEELKSVFPYIYKFVNEDELPVVELAPEDILGENTQAQTDLGDGFVLTSVNAFGSEQKAVLDTQSNMYIFPNRRADGSAIARTPASYLTIQDGKTGSLMKLGPATNAAMTKAGLLVQPQPVQQTPESQFESFMDSLISEDQDEIFSPNVTARQAAIKKLNQLFTQELKGGPEGINAIQSLKGLIDDPEFLNSLRDVDSELDVRPLVQQYIASRDEEVASQLEFGDSAGPADVEPAPVEPTAAAPEPAPAQEPAPVEPTAAAPAPAEEPVPAPVAESKQSLVNAIQKAKKAGATMETMIGNKTIAELIEECGMEPADVGFGQAEPGIDGMLKYVSGFYNKDQGNFPLGGMRVKIKVKKAFEDGEFGNVDESDLIKVLKFIDHKDPSGNVDQQMEAPQVQDECGTMPSFDVSTLETQIQSVSESSGYDEIKRLVSLVHYR